MAATPGCSSSTCSASGGSAGKCSSRQAGAGDARRARAQRPKSPTSPPSWASTASTTRRACSTARPARRPPVCRELRSLGIVRDVDLLLNVWASSPTRSSSGRAPARLPRHRSRLPADVAGPRSRGRLRRPRRARDGRRADRPAGLRDPRPAGWTGSRRRSRSCSSVAARRAAAADRSRASRAGAARTARSSTPASARPARARVPPLRALPELTGRAFELALEIHAAEAADLALLRDTAGRSSTRRGAAEPRATATTSPVDGGVDGREGHVRAARSGWFSDRASATSPAVGRSSRRTPACERPLPAGAGLLAFATLDEAAACVEAIAVDYSGTRAARAIAEERFDSDRVLGRLLDRLGVA